MGLGDSIQSATSKSDRYWQMLDWSLMPYQVVGLKNHFVPY